MRQIPYSIINFKRIIENNFLYKDKFEELFGNLYIGKNPTENRNKYYVLNFDFSGMENNTIDEMQDVFADKVKEGIKMETGKIFYHRNSPCNIRQHDDRI